jgi:hypothetical protein
MARWVNVAPNLKEATLVSSGAFYVKVDFVCFLACESWNQKPAVCLGFRGQKLVESLNK